MDNIQKELDLFEMELFKLFFGQDYENNKTFKTVQVVYGTKINAYISRFEAFMRPLMLNSGLVDATKIKQLADVKFPEYANLLPKDNFRLVSVINIIKSIRGNI